MRRLGLLLLLAGPFIAGPALSSYFVFFESGLATNSTVNLTVDAAPQAPSEGSASVFTYRVGQLEAQQNQAPSRDELTSTQQQAENLRGQLGQATEQLKASQDRVDRLEAQLRQAPSLTQQEAENISPVTSTTPSCEAVSCSFALSPRADPGAARR